MFAQLFTLLPFCPLVFFSCPLVQLSSSSPAWLPALSAFLLFVLISWLCGLAFGVGWVVGFLSLSDGFRYKKKGRFLRPFLRCVVSWLLESVTGGQLITGHYCHYTTFFRPIHLQDRFAFRKVRVTSQSYFLLLLFDFLSPFRLLCCIRYYKTIVGGFNPERVPCYPSNGKLKSIV